MKNYWKVYAYCRGVKKGCRKVDMHQVVVGEFPITEEMGVIETEAKCALRRAMRRIDHSATLYAKLSFMTAEETGVVTWQPFSGNDKRIDLKFAC